MERFSITEDIQPCWLQREYCGGASTCTTYGKIIVPHAGRSKELINKGCPGKGNCASGEEKEQGGLLTLPGTRSVIVCLKIPLSVTLTSRTYESYAAPAGMLPGVWEISTVAFPSLEQVR